jgi:hypothetical protein
LFLQIKQWVMGDQTREQCYRQGLIKDTMKTLRLMHSPEELVISGILLPAELTMGSSVLSGRA